MAIPNCWTPRNERGLCGNKLYLDDDSVKGLLRQLLTQAGHDVVLPSDCGTSGAEDPVHLTVAIRIGRVLISGNHDDYENLHDLIKQAQGHHPGVLIVRYDNDPRRDISPRGVVNAISKLASAGIDLADGFFVLNHWR